MSSSLSAERASHHQLTDRCCLLGQNDSTVSSLTHRGRLPPSLRGRRPREQPRGPYVEKLGWQPGLPCLGPPTRAPRPPPRALTCRLRPLKEKAGTQQARIGHQNGALLCLSSSGHSQPGWFSSPAREEGDGEGPLEMGRSGPRRPPPDHAHVLTPPAGHSLLPLQPAGGFSSPVREDGGGEGPLETDKVVHGGPPKPRPHADPTPGCSLLPLQLPLPVTASAVLLSLSPTPQFPSSAGSSSTCNKIQTPPEELRGPSFPVSLTLSSRPHCARFSSAAETGPARRRADLCPLPSALSRAGSAPPR